MAPVFYLVHDLYDPAWRKPPRKTSGHFPIISSFAIQD
ncbi:hypothetical protein EV130_106177 [Rhizobium azibense]|uniref:Uncharacterized protein n=1 Tax=Rhizobium azibense TaxID=1136135 RepID=A0A4R3RTE7_9HYPH|nr:hypothetical protein EV130_106177 [Rhizobium azibense]TCU39333.1 hypothetical protein EV129_103179 [Rhizobium azibense]